DIPAGYDVHISFVFDELLGQLYRVYLFVNGWMMGKRVGNLGTVCKPQSKFPVQERLLDYHRENTVTVALWAMEEGIPITPLSRLYWRRCRSYEDKQPVLVSPREVTSAICAHGI
ncbi:hypothetical protein EDD18DRAFT_1063162, partial [Armillaria luteobubalina]